MAKGTADLIKEALRLCRGRWRRRRSLPASESITKLVEDALLLLRSRHSDRGRRRSLLARKRVSELAEEVLLLSRGCSDGSWGWWRRLPSAQSITKFMEDALVLCRLRSGDRDRLSRTRF
jgi:hypothetical protein